MFWLVRAAPAHMLRLQAGRFDAPDRLFSSVREAWEGVTSSNPADVKELTPEFYLRCAAPAGRPAAGCPGGVGCCQEQAGTTRLNALCRLPLA